MTTPALASSAPMTALERAIQDKDYDRIEECWMELVSGQPGQVGTFIELASRIARAVAPSQASLLLQMLVPDLMSNQSHKDAYEVLKKAAELTPGDRDIRGLLVECIRQLHKGHPLLTKALEASQLADASDVHRKLDVFETHMTLGEGGYVYHDAGWGVGKITRVDIENDEVFIDFRARKGHRMSHTSMSKMLKRLEVEDYRVLLEYAPERLKELAAADPAGVVKKVIHEEGRPLTPRQLKALLADRAVPSASWSKWWSDARDGLRRDPKVSLATGVNPLIELRQESVTYEESMLARYREDRSIVAQTGVVREYLKHLCPEEASRFLAPVLADMKAKVDSGTIHPSDALSLCLLHGEIQAVCPQAAETPFPDIRTFLTSARDVPSILERLPIEDYRRDLLPVIREIHTEGWRAIYQELLLSECENIWDLVYRGLFSKGDHDRIREAYRESGRRRDERPENFAWFCRAGIHGRISTELLGHSRVELFEDLLRLLDRLGSERGSVAIGREARLHAGRVRHVLFQEIGDRVTKLFEEAGEESTRHLLQVIINNRGLDEYQIHLLERKAYVVFPALDAHARKAEEEAKTIYVSAEGLEKRRAALQRLLQVDLPTVAKDIGRAKELGDLSENAEYSAALEKQAQLAQRAKTIEEELKFAKIITPDMVHDSEVSMGTRVTLRNAQGQTESLTILGPWDADYDRKVISYQTVVARGILGCKLGETVTVDLPEGPVTYQVMGIAKAIS